MGKKKCNFYDLELKNAIEINLKLRFSVLAAYFSMAILFQKFKTVNSENFRPVINPKLSV